jgi:Mrp family chromosome partitioning ATPase
VPPFPAELLGAERMVKLLSEWREQFDFIVIDSPPILPVSDAYSLSALADATVLVTRVGQTSRVALQRAYGTLLQYAKENVTPTIGVVLNSMPIHSAGYYDYYGYYGNKKSAYYEERGKQ